MSEIYDRAMDLAEELKGNAPVEEVWPILEDLSFHSAIFTTYYFMFESMLSKMLLEKGNYSINDPACIVGSSSIDSLQNAIMSTTEAFRQLIDSYERGDIADQHKYMRQLYLATAQIQFYAALNKCQYY